MKKNNILTLLIVMVIILSVGLAAATAKIISMDKKIEGDKNPIIVEKPDLPIVEEPIIDENPPKEIPPKEEPPKVEKPKEPVIVESKFISSDEAIKIGKNKVGADAKLIKIEADLDNNPPKYNIELVLGNYEYELEIHAITGAVIDFERDEFDD